MAENTDQAKLFEKVKELSFPRAAGTEGGRKVEDLILNEWNNLKEKNPSDSINIRRMDFSYPEDTPRVVKGIFVMGFAVLVVLDLYFLFFMEQKPYTLLPILFSFIMLFGIYSGTRWNRIIELFYSRKEKDEIKTCNIEAAIKAGKSDTRKTVVFMAHHDSKSQTVGFLTRFVAAGICFALVHIIAVYSIAYAGYISQAMQNWHANIQVVILRLNMVIVILGLLLNIIIAVFHFVKSGNLSPGALDNASGLAVLTALFEKYAQSPPVGVNLLFVATGAEEDGLIGSVKYMEAMEKELDKKTTVFVNLDSVGGTAPLQVIDKYGIPQVKTAARLTEDIKKAAGEAGLQIKQLYSPAGAGYDSIPAAFRGYESVTLTNCKFDKPLHDIHSAGDIIENVSAEGVLHTFILCCALVDFKGNQ